MDVSGRTAIGVCANAGHRAALAAAVLLALVPATSWGRLDVRIAPNPILVGEAAQFVAVCDEGKPDLVAGLPRVPNVEWLGGPSVSQSFQISNRQRTVSVTVAYVFRAVAAGRIQFPALEWRVGNRTVSTPAVECQVVERTVQTPGGGATKIGDLVYGKIRILGGEAPPARVYVGQEVPIEIRLYVLESLFAGRATYPELEFPNTSFRDYAEVNPDSPKFARPDQRREIVNGMPFSVITFVCAVTPLATGTLSGTGTIRCSVADTSRAQSRRRPGFGYPFDDSVFDNAFGARAVERTVTLELPPVPVVPVPPAPADAGTFLGLVGQWEARLACEPAAVRVGDPVTVELSLQGRGNVEALVVPRLEMDGFRVHEPEVRKSANAAGGVATVTWVLIPLTAGKHERDLLFCTFDPTTDTYRPIRSRLAVTASPAAVAESVAMVADAGPTGKPAARAEAEKRAATDILYLETRPGPYVKRPLWRNVVVPALALVLVGALAYLGCWQAAERRRRLSGSDTYRRRAQAERDRSRVLRALRRCPEPDRPRLIREDLVPCLAALLELPPGTTPTALAEAIQARDPVLAEALRRAEHGSYMPGGADIADVRDLAKRAGRLAVVALLGALLVGQGHAATPAIGPDLPPGGLPAAPAPVVQPAPALPPAAVLPAAAPLPAGGGPVTLEQGTQAYEQGRLDDAVAVYRQLARPGTENASLLYNLGNCAYRQGELGLAVACYERARRLAPRDSDIRENLNFVRDRLGLEPVLPARNPYELLLRLRESLRPDEWVLLAAWLVCAWGVWAGWRRWRGRPTGALAIGLGVALLVALLAAWGQVQSTYRPGSQGVVTAKAAAAHRLPTAEAERTRFDLKPGHAVTIMEERTEWYRIRVGDDDGWVRKEDVTPVW